MKKGVTGENTLGYRLSIFLENTFSGESHASKSRKFGFPNTTVIEWENGRSLPEDAYKRLVELGCDLTWLLTGKRSETQKSPPSPGGDEYSIQKLFSSLAEAHKALSILAESVVSGDVSVEDAENAVAEALKTVWQVHDKPTKADKRRHSKTDTRDTGTSA